MIGTISKFVIYDKKTNRLSKHSNINPAYSRIYKKDKHVGNYIKRRRTGPNNIQFPMIRGESYLWE